MALIKHESIEAVIDACDMLEIIAPYTTIRKSGNSYMGRCPFHSEKDPSFSVDPVKKVYYCFSCGEKGNLVNFVMEKEGLDFPEAIRFLADRYGIDLQYEQSDPEAEERRRNRERIYSLLDQAASFYARLLKQSSVARRARDYLKVRGFSDQTIDDFRLGYSPPGGGELLKKATDKGYSRAELVQAGLVRERDGRAYDYFRGRLMFPFTDHRGRVLGFGARVLDDSKPKYINSPDSRVYHKSDLVFGLGNARKSSTREDRIYIVEGYTDVLALNQAGIGNAVASMGTALTESQLKEVSRFTKNVYLALDADAAGQRAMLRALEMSKKLDIAVRLVEVPAGSDPAELVLSEGGVERFNQLAGQSLTLLEYQVHAAIAASDLERSEGKVEAFRSLKEILENAADSVERDEQSRVIADRLNLSPENVAYLLESSPDVDSAQKRGEARRVLSQGEIAERSFLSQCLAHPGEAGRYLQDMTEAHFTTEPNRSAFNWVKERLGGAVASTGDAGDAESILPELIIRSETEAHSPDALPELYWRLMEGELMRKIKRLKAKLDMADKDTEEFHEIVRLEVQRRRILDFIQAGNFNTA